MEDLKEHSISSEPSEYLDFSTTSTYSTGLLIGAEPAPLSTQQKTKRQFLHPTFQPVQKSRQQTPPTRRQFLDPTSHIASGPLPTRQASFISSVSQVTQQISLAKQPRAFIPPAVPVLIP